MLNLRSFSAGMSSTAERKAVDNDKPITRVLFCGPHFPASQIYTREYLEKYPFIQVLCSNCPAYVLFCYRVALKY